MTDDGATPVDHKLPRHVAQTLAALAHILDREVLDREPESAAEFACRTLGVAPGDLVSTRETLPGASFALACRTLGRDIAERAGAEIVGTAGRVPGWQRLTVAPGETELIPADLAVHLPAGGDDADGARTDVPLVVVADVSYGERELAVYSRREHQRHAESYLTRLLARARGRDNVFRGRCLKAALGPNGPWFEVVAPPDARRDDVVLPAALWAELDVNVGRMFDRAGLLADAGLGTDRGVLLVGPPGTGKTAACRVLAAENTGPVTVVLADARVLAAGIEWLYAELVHLAPALVILEDIDLVVGQRRSASGLTLHAFLQALDGVLHAGAGVVTVATTNDAAAIDAAAKRAARFDRILDIAAPDEDGRAKILARYLASLPADVDVAAVARATDGLTGADLRELARRGVLEHGSDVSTDQLLGLARRGVTPDSRPGNYL